MLVIAAPPELKVTTGVDIVSDAVNVRVITSSALARVFVELLEAMLTELSVGALNKALKSITPPVPYSAIIAVAPLNIFSDVVTLLVFQPEIS